MSGGIANIAPPHALIGRLFNTNERRRKQVLLVLVLLVPLQ